MQHLLEPPRTAGNDVPFVLPTLNAAKIGWHLYQGGATPNRFDL